MTPKPITTNFSQPAPATEGSARGTTEGSARGTTEGSARGITGGTRLSTPSTGRSFPAAIYSTVYQECGPNPIDNAVNQLIYFNDHPNEARIRLAMSQCANLHADIDSFSPFIDNVKSCLSQTLGPEEYDTIKLSTTSWASHLYFITPYMDEWYSCQQGALNMAVPQTSGIVRPGLSTSPLTIPVVQPVVPQKTIPVFDHPARYVLDEIRGKLLDFHRVYPNGREVHYSLTITGDLIKIEWPGVTDYFDVKRISYDYGTKSYPQALVLADCTIRIQVLANGQKILEIAPK